MRAVTVVVVALWSCVLPLAVAGVSWAEEFRIDTEVFIGSEREPAVETLTVFSQGRIYDFLLTKPEEITLFEPSQARITLIDVNRQVKAVLETRELLDAVLSLQAAAEESKDEIFRAAAKPLFETKSEEFTENGAKFTRFTLEGTPIMYKAVGQVARHPDAAREFKYFADWSWRLNSVRPGNLPAGARLQVNDLLSKQNLIPTRIDRVITPSVFARKIEMHSKHLVNWRLSAEDRKRIDTTGDYLANFQVISFDDYCRPNRKPAPVQPAPVQQANIRGLGAGN
jgi:hypothetical protein